MRATRRVPILLASVVLAALAGLAGCGTRSDSAAAALSMPPATDLPGLQSVGLHQVWQRQMRLEPGERVKKAWRLGRSIYVATTDSRIVRLDAKTGVLKWSQGLGQENFEIYQPIELKSSEGIPTGEVLVVTRGEAFIFNMETGDQVRMQRMNISVSADPVVVGNTLCIGGADTFYGMYLDRLGMKRWKIPQPGDLFISAPVAMDNNVLLATRAGHLWRITADTGDWEWKDRKTNGLITAGLAADFNAVYVPCEDQRVYAFRTDTGSELWEQQLDDRLEETPVMAGPVILVTAVNRKMSALARPTGVIKWTQDDVWQVATVNEETVWIGDSSGKIRLLALDTGAEKAAALTTGIQLFVRNNMDQNVILVTHAGLIGMYSPSTVNEKP